MDVLCGARRDAHLQENLHWLSGCCYYLLASVLPTSQTSREKKKIDFVNPILAVKEYLPLTNP